MMKKILSAILICLLLCPLWSCDKPTKDLHTALAEEEYFQYSTLTAVEKDAYLRLKSAVLSYQNTIDISDLALTDAEAWKVRECFVADHPQYFWIDPSFLAGNAQSITFRYTDGTATDWSGTGNADRAKIDERRALFDRTVAEIVSAIPVDATAYEKELAIHSYLLENVTYDTTAAENLSPDGNTVYPAYHAYGVLTEGVAICTGYAKAFQTLCYAVGINANCVKSIDHEWNTVLLDGEWYQVDVTWNDTGEDCYAYFNLTTAEMYQTHELHPQNVLTIPECTATRYAYQKN